MTTTTKTQSGQPPHKPPRGTIVLEDKEEPLRPKTSVSTSPPGGKMPPPKKPFLPTTDHPPEAEAQLVGGPQDGSFTTIADAQKYLKQGFGYKDLASNKNYGQTGAPEPQTKHAPTQIQQSDYQRLAQQTKTIPAAQKPRIVSPYQPATQQALKELDDRIKNAPSARERIEAQEIKKQIEQRLKEQEEQKNGPITSQKQLDTVKKMISVFKNAYYTGYAEISGGQENYHVNIAHAAANMEKNQIFAMKNAMTVFNDAFRGVDLATKDFFYKALGPLGQILEHYNQSLINFNMDYHMGRAWWSPEHLNYLIKELPQEKFFDLVYEQGKNLVYFITRLSNNSLFSKVEYHDAYGKKRAEFLAFRPYIFIKHHANSLGSLLDGLTNENIPVLGGPNTLSDVEENFFKAQKEFNRFYFNPNRKPNDPIPLDLYKDMLLAEERVLLAKKETLGGLFNPILDIFNKDKKIKIPARERLRARFFRSFGLKGLANGLRKDTRDPISWVAFVLGSWIGDLVFGNLGRLIAERIITSRLGSLLASKYVVTGQMSLGALNSFGRAFFSTNTFGGGLIGYELGGPIGGVLGAGGGWAWQTIRNFGLDTQRMQWVKNYYEMQKWPQGLSRQYIQGPTVGNPATTIKIGRVQFNLGAWSAKPFTSWFVPGPISRFAYWLNNGVIRTTFLGNPLNFPIGRLLQPLPSVFVNGTLIRWYVSPFLTSLGTQLGWDPGLISFLDSGFFQYGAPYLWEIKGLLGEGFSVLLRAGTNNLLYSGGRQFFLNGQLGAPRITYGGGGPGIGYAWEGGAIKGIAYDVGPVGGALGLRGATGFYVQNVTGFYGKILNFRANIFNLYDLHFNQPFYRFLQQHTTIRSGLNFSQNVFKSWGKVGVTNFAGFFVGWEIASMLGISPFLGGLVGWFAINPLISVLDVALRAVGFLPAQAASLVSMFSTGFWLGAGVQFVAGLFGIALPAFFPLATGLLFMAVPPLLVGIGSLVGGTLGSFLVSMGTMASLSVVSLAGLSVVLSVTSLAGLGIFAVIVIGSAFWIPLQETLQGITPQSMCFDINSPLINGKNEPAVFNKGDKKEICWTTVNKTPLYQGPIVKSKTFDPTGSFSIDNYRVTVVGPDGKTEAAWNNAPGQNGKYSLSKEIAYTYGASPNGDPTLIPSGATFKITPPEDTGSQQCISEALQKEVLPTDANTSPVEIIVSNTVVEQALNMLINNTLLYYQLDFLKTNPANHAVREQEIQKNLAAINTHALFKNNLSKIGDSPNLALSCYLWGQSLAQTTPSTQPMPHASCTEILKSVKVPSNTELQTLLSGKISEYKNLSPAEISETIKKIEAQKNAIDQTASSFIQRLEAIKRIKQIPPLPQNPTEQQKQDRLNGLKEVAKAFCSSSTNYYLPVGSQITVCLNIVYKGESGATATINEKDSAEIPLLGPLTTNACQAQLPLAVNAGPSQKIQWPTGGKKEINQGYQYNPAGPTNQNHTGIDINGKIGDPVLAASDGVVVARGMEARGFGYYLIIRGTSGEYSIYAHMGTTAGGDASAFAANTGVGSLIKAGTAIGYLGNSGNATGPHLHFGISTNQALSGFYNNSVTTLNPCNYIIGGCP